jgi:hypothetical protein
MMSTTARVIITPKANVPITKMKYNHWNLAIASNPSYFVGFKATQVVPAPPARLKRAEILRSKIPIERRNLPIENLLKMNAYITSSTIMTIALNMKMEAYLNKPKLILGDGLKVLTTANPSNPEARTARTRIYPHDKLTPCADMPIAIAAKTLEVAMTILVNLKP